jgi:hypothetical protein
MLDRKTIEELNELSLSVFGVKSRWRKLVDRGSTEIVMEDTTRLHADGTKENVQTPVMHEGKAGGQLQKQGIVRYTPESIKEKMLFMKKQRDEMFATLLKQQEEQKAAMQAQEEAKNAVSSASGSSL